jgi:hypothetical protein
MMMSTEWKVGDFVKVSLPHGTDNKSVHYATIEAVRDVGPSPANPQRNIKVSFDDSFLYGGLGVAWVSPDVIVNPDEEAAPSERTTE